MSKWLKVEFEIARQSLWKDLEQTSGDIYDIQPKGFNNTIHWQLGHILTTAENFLFGQNVQVPASHNEIFGFGFHKQFHENPVKQLPASYNELFGFGSKPSNWSGDVPTVDTLVEQLKNQLNRIKKLPDEIFEIKLPEPIMGKETYGELASMTAFHESNHIAQIHIMKKLIENN